MVTEVWLPCRITRVENELFRHEPFQPDLIELMRYLGAVTQLHGPEAPNATGWAEALKTASLLRL